MKKLLRAVFATAFILALTNTTSYAFDCCNPDIEHTITPITTECGAFEICLSEEYDDNECDIIYFSLTQLFGGGTATQSSPTCFTVTGLTPGTTVSFNFNIGSFGCGLISNKISYPVPYIGCGEDCCDLDITADVNAVDCGEFNVCLSGLGDDCNTVISAINVTPANATFKVDDDCITFTGLNIGTTVDFDILVQVPGCDDVLIDDIPPYTVTEEGCDPCCLPPDIGDVTFTPITGTNYMQICVPEYSCQSATDPRYILNFTKTCPPGGSTSPSNQWNTTNCFYFPYEECCEYEFRIGYISDVCTYGGIQYSDVYTFESQCCETEPNPDFELDFSITECTFDVAINELYDVCACCPEGIENVTLTYELWVNGVSESSVTQISGSGSGLPNAECTITQTGASFEDIFCDLRLDVGDELHITLELSDLETFCLFDPALPTSFQSNSITVTQDILDACTDCVVDCCAGPVFEDVEVDITPNETLKICIPEYPCAGQHQVLYVIQYLEFCTDGTFVFETLTSLDNCFELEHSECCEYDFRVAYFVPDCGHSFNNLDWSPWRHIPWSSNCLVGGGGSGSSFSIDDLNQMAQDKMPAQPLALPNPFTDEFQIQIDAIMAETYQLAIYDMDGKELLQLDGNLDKGFNQISVDQLNDIPAGIYIYQLNTPTMQFSDKIVKY